MPRKPKSEVAQPTKKTGRAPKKPEPVVPEPEDIEEQEEEEEEEEENDEEGDEDEGDEDEEGDDEEEEEPQQRAHMPPAPQPIARPQPMPMPMAQSTPPRAAMPAGLRATHIAADETVNDESRRPGSAIYTIFAEHPDPDLLKQAEYMDMYRKGEGSKKSLVSKFSRHSSFEEVDRLIRRYKTPETFLFALRAKDMAGRFVIRAWESLEYDPPPSDQPALPPQPPMPPTAPAVSLDPSGILALTGNSVDPSTQMAFMMMQKSLEEARDQARNAREEAREREERFRMEMQARITEAQVQAQAMVKMTQDFAALTLSGSRRSDTSPAVSEGYSQMIDLLQQQNKMVRSELNDLRERNDQLTKKLFEKHGDTPPGESSMVAEIIGAFAPAIANKLMPNGPPNGAPPQIPPGQGPQQG